MDSGEIDSIDTYDFRRVSASIFHIDLAADFSLKPVARSDPVTTGAQQYLAHILQVSTQQGG